MKFEDLTEYPHPHWARAYVGEKCWRIYFPNGKGLDIVGGPQHKDVICVQHPTHGIRHLDALYGDGINTFEVAVFHHDLKLKETSQGILNDMSQYDCDTTFQYKDKDFINYLIDKVEHS